jgi:hypothetical protein
MIRERISDCKPLNLLHELNGTDVVTDAVRYGANVGASPAARQDEARTLVRLTDSLGRVSHLHRCVLLCDLLPLIYPIQNNPYADPSAKRAAMMKLTNIIALADALRSKLPNYPVHYVQEIVARECGENHLVFVTGNPAQTYSETQLAYGVTEHAQRKARRIVRQEIHSLLLAAGAEWEALYVNRQGQS